MLEIQALSAGYGSRLALENINLTIHNGEVVSLVGPNGAGKSTLIRSISGVLQPLPGAKILVNGMDQIQLSQKLRARSMAVVPQARNLPDTFTVRETVLLGRTPYLGWLGKPSEQDLERVEWALETTDSLSISERFMGELSGGEQQRVLLARALAQDTPILLLDEPTAHLDLHYQSSLLSLISRLAAERRLAVLMALHDLNLAAVFSSRVALLVKGHLQAVGNPTEVLTSEHLRKAFQVELQVISHPEYGVPLILPDGRQ